MSIFDRHPDFADSKIDFTNNAPNKLYLQMANNLLCALEKYFQDPENNQDVLKKHYQLARDNHARRLGPVDE